MSTDPRILGVSVDRPPAPPRRYVSTDWNTWHTHVTIWEAVQVEVRLEAAAGTLDLPDSCKRMGRRGGGPQVRPDRLPLDKALDAGRHILVEARVVTAPCAAALSRHDVRVLLEDLQRRIATRRELGLEPKEPSDDG